LIQFFGTITKALKAKNRMNYVWWLTCKQNGK